MIQVNDQYAPMGEQQNGLVKAATREARMGFVRKVYGILAMQLALTAMIAAPFSKLAIQWSQTNPGLVMASQVFSVVVALGTVCAMSCKPELGRSYPTNMVLLMTFTLAEALTVGFACSLYPAQTVISAVVLTALIFVGMTMVAFFSKDFTGAGPYLVSALMALCAFGFGLMILQMFGVNMPLMAKVYSALGAVLFTLYIVYDTQLIIGSINGHKFEFGIDDYVFAALTLYLDIINLFLDILRLLGSNRD